MQAIMFLKEEGRASPYVETPARTTLLIPSNYSVRYAPVTPVQVTTLSCSTHRLLMIEVMFHG